MPDPSQVPDFCLGSPVDPEDLRFRDDFIDSLWDILLHEDTILSAPRRTGKTSVMDHLAEFPRQSFSPVKVYYA